MHERHPYSATLRDLTLEETATLRRSLIEGQQTEDLVLYQDKVLDGWNRYQIMLSIGMPPKFRTFVGDDEQARHYVRSKIAGRSCTPSQKIEMYHRLDETPVPGKAIRVSADTRIEEPKRRRGGQPKAASGKSVAEQAAEAGVSRASLARDGKVRSKGSPALVEAMSSGAVSLNDAAGVADLPHEAQDAAVAAKLAGEAKTVRAAAGVATNGHGNAAPAPKLVRSDAVGVAVPTHVLPAFHAGDEIVRLCRQLDQIGVTLAELSAGLGGRLIHASVAQTLKSARKTLHGCRATHVCPSCQGQGQCTKCQGEGWVSATYFGTATPDERKAAKARGADNVAV
jgi:hypothetical protein